MIVVKVPALLLEFRRLLDFQEDVNYTMKGTVYPEENVIIYDINDAKREEKKRRNRRKKDELEASSGQKD